VSSKSQTIAVVAEVMGKQLKFSGASVVTIGRSDSNDIVVPEGSVSRSHCELRFDDKQGKWKVIDLASANGVYFKGVRVSEAWLGQSAFIRLGESEDDVEISIRFEKDDSHASSPKTLIAQKGGVKDVVIGKSADADFIISDVLVSRRHARLMHVGSTLFLEDLGSTNGTFVNGRIISGQPVADGDIITIGNTDLTIRDGEVQYLRRPDEISGGLIASNLCFEIKGGKKLLSGVDLHIPPGNLTAVIGPSGAGKSTLLRALAGITRPTSGSVHFDNFSVHDSFDIVSSRIGLVPQDDVLHTTLKLSSALMYGARLRLRSEEGNQARVEQVNKVIEKLELTSHKETRINRLSGGQRKRASVALELLTEPSLLILDEPTSGLDPAMDRQVMKTLRELADDNRGVLVVTHSVAHLEVCDDVLVLAPGGIPAYYGPPAGIKKFFSTTDWADIFEQIKANPQEVYERYKQQQVRNIEPPEVVGSVNDSKLVRSSPWFEQFATLCERQLNLVRSDVGYLLFLVALPLLVGMLILVVPGGSGFDAASNDAIAEPSQLLAMLVIGSAFMGTSISIRDLVGERAIFLRERAVGLPVSAYLASKILIFGIFATLMVAALTAVTLRIKPVPTQNLIISPPWLELLLALSLTALAAMVIGLFFSALVKSSEQVMPLLVVILMAQLVLNGGLLPLEDRPIITEASYVVVAKWGFAMAASGFNLEGISPNLTMDPLWAHDNFFWFQAAAALVGLTIIAATATRIRLEGKYDR
jgi:ABC-type multidrug transport system ATPase subunit/pSer/pThr/pTyr-binding forkhead associated (FHA) protein